MALDWRTQAACHDADADLFFSPAERDIEQAQSICRGCPVTTDCLSDAMASETVRVRDRWGIRAAYTPAQRVRIYKGYSPRKTGATAA